MPKRLNSADEFARKRRRTTAAQVPFVGELQPLEITISLRSRSKASQDPPRRIDNEKAEALGPNSDSSKQDPPVGLPDDLHGKQTDFNTLDALNCSHSKASDQEPQSDDDSDRSSLDEFSEWPWLEPIDGFVTEKRRQVAACDVKLIRRDEIVSKFWFEMEEPTRGTSDLAFELFDRYGRLDAKYYEHKVKRGTGVWGSEMDEGDILLFESLSVASSRRRRGLATKLAQAVLAKAREKSLRFVALVRPGYLATEVTGKNETRIQEHLAASKQFWRSLGFRRVGTSPWFAFVEDPSHPSRHLAISDDWDEPGKHDAHGPVPETTKTAFAALTDPERLDDQSVRDLQANMPADISDARWLSVDGDGNTVLHLAAMFSKARAVDYIFSRCPDLAWVRNREGYTPLEALQADMESARTTARLGGRTAVRSDKFKGFGKSSISCIGILTSTRIFDLEKLPPEDLRVISSATDQQASSISEIDAIRYTLRLKYGCTCGECIGGFLSPRMRFALFCEAEYQSNVMFDCIDESGPRWALDNEDELAFLPKLVRRDLATNQSMRQGFVNLCSYAAMCLKQRKLPDEANVLAAHQSGASEWPPVTKNYLQRGGTVSAVVTMLFDRAMNNDECSGDGYHREIFESKINRLPKCRNDHEFGFVSGMCGYERISTVRLVNMWGRPIDTD